MEYGCIGEHLPHSFSREIHQLIGDYDYQLREIERGDLCAFMKAADFRAINVTIPYKEAVIPYLSDISPKARAIGAVNTIVNRDGKLFGDNTDFSGMDALLQRLGIDPCGKKVLILGTGGTSKTAKALMESHEARAIYRVSRRKSEEDPGIITYEEAYSDHTDAEIIVNTTPVGMFPETDACPLDFSAFPNLLEALDAVYNPLRTIFVQQAEDRKIRSEGGLYMLVAQAVYASALFTGRPVREGMTERIFKKLCYDKENIVITGMSGAGKSAVGKALRRITGRKLVDTDALIAADAGMSIPEIFEKFGEEGFRAMETEAIRSTSRENGIIISTGGGAVLREKNLRELKKNGRIFFLQRDISEIEPSPDRPLADTREKVAALYRARLPLYLWSADSVVLVKGTPEDTAGILLKNRLES